MNIEIVSGSPRTESVTYRVALFLQKHLKETTGHSINMIDVRQWNFPALQQAVYSSVDTTPDPYKPLTERMFAADAFIIVTPEYNGSYTSSIKNLFDHYPKQMHKTFGIATASVGGFGGLRASQQLQLFIMALFGIASPYMLVVPAVDKKIDAAGMLIDETLTNTVHTFCKEFLWLVEKISS